MAALPKPISVVHRRLHGFLKHHALSGGRLLVAVSGGPDSVCLLYSLWSLQAVSKIDLHAAHLDHQLRGAESSGDAAYVARLCRQLEVPYSTEAIDVATYGRRRRLTLEEAARDVRYAFLRRTAKEVGAVAVVLGHTANDQAETVLMHILRGTSVSGLRGMDAISQRDGIYLARPLLTTARGETEAYCAAVGLSPRIDASNLNGEQTRNRIRLELMPLLRQFNPQVQSAVNRLARNAGELTGFLEQEAEQAWQATAKITRPDEVRLDRHKLVALPSVIQVALLRRAIQHVRGLRNISEIHLAPALRLLRGPTGKRMELPGGLSLSLDYDEVMFSQGGISCLSPSALDGDVRLQVPGITLWEGWEVTVELLAQRATVTKQDRYRAILDATLANVPLRVRSRRPGDRFQPAGLDGTKKVQDFLVDAKVPQRLRDHVPLLCGPKGILWVVGHRLAQGTAARGARRLRVTFRNAAANPP